MQMRVLYYEFTKKCAAQKQSTRHHSHLALIALQKRLHRSGMYLHWSMPQAVISIEPSDEAVSTKYYVVGTQIIRRPYQYRYSQSLFF